MTWGEQLKLARQRAGWSQDKLAEMAGVTGPMIWNWESGKTEASIKSREKIESVLGPLSDTEPRDVPEADTDTTTNGSEAPRKDSAPRPKKSAGAKKSSAPARGKFTLADQLELPYKLGANFLNPRLPQTAGVLYHQARPCAEAWDNFLWRYPALREKIEQGMIASDIVALLMAHAPIFQAAIAETQAINAMREQEAAGQYPGGVGVGG